jgi:mRNA interferase MazF
MPIFSRNETILVRYPFSNLSTTKVRPTVVVHAPHPSQDSFIVPLTSRLDGLLPGEFALTDWRAAGMNVPTAVKRGLYTIHPSLVLKRLALLADDDAKLLEQSLRQWLGLA